MDTSSPSYVPMSLTSELTTTEPGKRTYRSSQVGSHGAPNSSGSVSARHSRNASLPAKVSPGELGTFSPGHDSTTNKGMTANSRSVKRASMRVESTAIAKALGMASVDDSQVNEKDNTFASPGSPNQQRTRLILNQPATSSRETLQEPIPEAENSFSDESISLPHNPRELEEIPNEQLRNMVLSLSQQLSQADNEKQKLQSRVKELEHTNGKEIALRQDDMERLEKAFEQQESLLKGYQRENERSVIALEEIKRRERKMQQHLQKLYGPQWEQEVMATPLDGRRSPTRPTTGIASSFKLQTPVNTAMSPLREMELADATEESIEQPKKNKEATKVEADAATGELDLGEIFNHIDSVRLLVKGMEHRFIERTAELDRLEEQSLTANTAAP